jgi:hypothetical protein
MLGLHHLWKFNLISAFEHYTSPPLGSFSNVDYRERMISIS